MGFNDAGELSVGDKVLTGELGNVTPLIVIPGVWTARDLECQAESIASMMSLNGGLNCITPRVVVTHASWNQREDFLRCLTGALSRIRPRPIQYPGVREKYDQVAVNYPGVLRLGSPRTGGGENWLFVPGLDLRRAIRTLLPGRVLWPDVR